MNVKVVLGVVAAVILAVLLYLYFYTLQQPAQPPAAPGRQLDAVENSARNYLSDTAKKLSDSQIKTAEKSAGKYLGGKAVEKPSVAELDSSEAEARKYLSAPH